MNRLLTTLLLYRNGCLVSRYISLESKIAKKKSLYYDALSACQPGWHEGTEDIAPFVKYILRTILAAYRDFEDRVKLVEKKLPTAEMVRRAAYSKIRTFTKQDILELCPSIGTSSVENALKQLIHEGVIVRHGGGRPTYYTRRDAEETYGKRRISSDEKPICLRYR